MSGNRLRLLRNISLKGGKRFLLLERTLFGSTINIYGWIINLNKFIIPCVCIRLQLSRPPRTEEDFRGSSSLLLSQTDGFAFIR